MIISHRLKFAFFRAPKTGTSTAQFMLRMCGAFDSSDISSGVEGGHFPAMNFPDTGTLRMRGEEVPEGFEFGAHMNPQMVLDAGLMTIEQLREYNCYSFLRHPYNRYLSGIVHIVGRHSTPGTCEGVFNNNLPDTSLHPKARKALGVIGHPQVGYFFANGEQVVEPLDFGNYESELRRMIAKVDGIDFPHIPRLNARPIWKDSYTADEFWSDDFRERFAIKYADDIKFYTDNFGEIQ